jgi:pilus assembly protein CpaB
MILTILDSPNGSSGNNQRRYLQIGLLALALLLVAVLGFRQVQRLMTPKKEVWVASSDLPVGSTIAPQNLRRAKVAESALPKGALLDANAIAGRELSRAKQEGEPFTGSDFAGASKAIAVAELVPEGRVLTTIRVDRKLVPYQNLKSGDRIDFVAIGGNAKVVAHDAYLVGKMVSRPPAAPSGTSALIPPPPSRGASSSTVGLIVAVHPEDALGLSKAASGGLRVVLHGKAEVASGNLIELPEHNPVEYIAGARRTQLVVVP